MTAPLARSCVDGLTIDGPSWMNDRAQRMVWCTLVGFAAVDWIRPQLALTQEWWCVLLVLWVVPWQRWIGVVSTWQTAMKWISSLILFAWLVSRTENAIQGLLRGWIIFGSPLLSHAWHVTVAALVTSLVTVMPLRRVLGEDSVKPIAVLAYLPYSSRLGGHAISPFMMMAVIAALRRLGFHREQIPGYVNTRRVVYRILKGEPNTGILFMVYASVWFFMLWLMTTWCSPAQSPPLRACICVTCTIAFPYVLSALVLAAIATWRSLATSTHGNFITENLKTLVRVLILFTIFPAALGGFFIGIPYSGLVVSEAVTRSAGPGWSITTSEDGHVVRVTGELRPGLSDAVTEVLGATPAVDRLELESPGGSVSEGLALAELVAKHSLDTAVKTYCASACTMVFVAGRERILNVGAQLGFHRCRSVLWFEEFLYDDQHNAELAGYFRSKGVSKAFADKVISVPSNDVWYPLLDQLFAAGVVTATSNPEA